MTDGTTKTTRTAGATKPRRLTQNDAILIKASKLSACLRKAKNLTPLQKRVSQELWDCICKWEFVRDNLHLYNLNGVRRKPD